MLPQASVPDIVVRGGIGSPLAVSLKKIDNWLEPMKVKVFEFEAMLSIRLHQRF